MGDSGVRAGRLLAGAIVAAICLGGALDAAAESVPASPKVLLRQASATSLLFTWSPVEAASGYDVYLGSARVGPTTLTKADLRNLACDTRYVVRVIAFDRGGRRSLPAVAPGKTETCRPGRDEPSPEPSRPTGSPPAGSPPPVGVPPGPSPSASGSLVVAGAGSDRNPCTAALPCATFDRAYHVAAPGQGVLVAAGSYPHQTIKADPTKAKAGADVIFQPAAGATVTAAGVSIQGSHLELRNLRTKWSVLPGAKGVTFRNVIADGLISITGASNVSVLGGEVYSPVPVSADPVISSLHGLVPTNILIDGVYFHDFVDVGPGQFHHIECLQVGGAVNLTIRNSTFRNCGTHDVFIRS